MNGSLQTECQGDDEDMHYPGEEGVAEYDSFLQESAGTILGPLAALLVARGSFRKCSPSCQSSSGSW